MTQGIIKINIREIPAYQNAKERQLQLVKENPFIEVTDSKTYEEADMLMNKYITLINNL